MRNYTQWLYERVLCLLSGTLHHIHWSVGARCWRRPWTTRAVSRKSTRWPLSKHEWKYTCVDDTTWSDEV